MLLTILAIIVAATFVFTGGIKLFSVPQSLEIRDRLEIPPGLWRVIGVLEWLGAAGVLIGLAYRPLGLLASIALAGLLVGAFISRLRAVRRLGRTDTAGLAGDVATLALAIVTAIAFGANL